MGNYLIFVPVYNEENNILPFIYNLFNFVDIESDEILIIDDNSTDKTSKILKEILKKKNFYLSKNPNVFKLNIIFNKVNLGYGSNVLKGMEYFLKSGKEFFITIDCDFQHLVSYINVFKSLSLKYNFITGTRYSKNSLKLSGYNFYRFLVNRKMLEFLKFYFKDYRYCISDFFCGFRLYSFDIVSKIWEKLKEIENKIGNISYEFPIFLWLELLKLNNLKLKEIPIPYITFENRNFKGNKSKELMDHYKRIEKYVNIFLSYINLSKREEIWPIS